MLVHVTSTADLHLEGLFAGAVARLAGDGRPSAIVKRRLDGPVTIDRTGLSGDQQADRRAHGGPDQAVHHYAAEHYAALHAAFPDAAVAFAPGALGENVSSRGVTERTVRIGDVFALGPVRLQVSQPRRPCWKIDARCRVEGVAAWIQQRGCTGWYYRVLEPGRVAPDDALECVDSDEHAPSVAELLQTLASHRPRPERLARLASLTALGEAWRARIHTRLQWLRARR